ncbi:hydroxyethylthiazole kinase [Actinobacillus succinogenes]|uniref:Hydroxyethylthiazole kinase n=1 Tax=Actinobacillus succinogenes (strain ATCC 55618 / DSM 22257 / CCUG 43843 / 130Z) TaxID=339671 RepID=THIM_ACTSZ|nr:hydroxyethylthiazole kinase [Actinobacillus succinogenes]A6VPG7.1 RecName: Full=Hydroxyethylthiazole kinase; AltName: Full=4-methyl-5-beta-hydroxyethylthiazole kinase; Short=TH kinase; Short=Thz kinase [Actinobacillus succinogenes 130Z]ABR74864.1 Hydroxyethylthiazole kinase [Actinobacillus succinogenes 130Z]PHI40726.1 hydroxyethylthiazole kinase [Actinobacillus succinogenes]
MQFRYLSLVRQQAPLEHCITNIVVTNFSANGLLALGASPFMSAMPQEVTEIQNFAQALLINIGTLNQSDVEAMLIAGKAANRTGVPVVLDPVGAGATLFRRKIVEQFLAEINFAVIRGNAAEIGFLAGTDWQGKGVDAGTGADSENLSRLAQSVAQKYRCVVALSGETDFISDGLKTYQICNGTRMLPKVTGSGCLLGAVIAAFLGVSPPQDYFSACTEACTVYAVAGELAAQGLSNEYGSFAMNFINQLGAIHETRLADKARVLAQHE